MVIATVSPVTRETQSFDELTPEELDEKLMNARIGWIGEDARA